MMLTFSDRYLKSNPRRLSENSIGLPLFSDLSATISLMCVSVASGICSKRFPCSGPRFSKVPRTFRARKAIRKITTCLFCKAGLFICCKWNKKKNNCKVSCLETPSFWRYKEYYVTRNTPEKFRDFRETGPWSFLFSNFTLKRACGLTLELTYFCF